MIVSGRLLKGAVVLLALALPAALLPIVANGAYKNPWDIERGKSQTVYRSFSGRAVNINVHNNGPCEVTANDRSLTAGSDTSFSGYSSEVKVSYPSSSQCTKGYDADRKAYVNAGTYTITTDQGKDLAPAATKKTHLTGNSASAVIYSRGGTALEVAVTMKNGGPDPVVATFKYGKSGSKDVNISRGSAVTVTGEFTEVSATLKSGWASRDKATVWYTVVKIDDGNQLFSTSVPSTPGAQVGGSLIIGVSGGFQGLDPRTSSSRPDSHAIGEIFDTLIGLDPWTLSPEPFIAKEWEILSEDKIRLYLNQGIMFHHGYGELTAEDVAFTLTGDGYVLPHDVFQSVEIVDDYTLDVWLKPECESPLYALAKLAVPIVCREAAEAMGDEYALAPIGSGPYELLEWIPGDRLVLERNEDYWLVYPNLDEIVYRPIPDSTVMRMALEAGEIDVADAVSAQDVPRLQGDPGIDVLQVPGLSYYYVFFNTESTPSSDMRFREAVYKSVDWDAAVFSIFQGLTADKAYGCIPPALAASDEEWLREHLFLEEDDDEAQRLFAELAAESLLPDSVRVFCPPDPQRRQLATILATSLIENGVQAEVVSLDWGPLLDVYYGSEGDPTRLDLAVGIAPGWYGSADPHDYVYPLLCSEAALLASPTNLAAYQNPEVDELIAQAAVALDLYERDVLFVQAQRIALGEYVHIPLYRYLQTTPIRSRVKGYVVDPLGAIILCDPYRNVWIE